MSNIEDIIELEESQQPTLKRFSFQQAQETLKEFHGSLSDAMHEERREDELLLPTSMCQAALDSVYDDISTIGDVPMNMIQQKQVFQPNSKVKL